MNVEDMLRVDNEQLDALAGVPGELGGEMMAEVRAMWQNMKRDLMAGWIVPAGVEASELKRLLHGQRGMVACWGLAGIAAGMLAAERADDIVLAWRENGPRLRAVLPRVFEMVETRHPGLRSGG